ncbi:hypothetical protein ACHQM5_014555 [Ranunculus cassubicifolius]
MGCDGVVPDAFTLNSMVQGFLSMRQVNQTRIARKLLKIMSEKGFSPNVDTTSMIVDLLQVDELDSKWIKMMPNFFPEGHKKGNQNGNFEN